MRNRRLGMLVLIWCLMLFGSMEVRASGLIKEDAGICGENITWEFNEASKTLILSGFGEMTDYSNVHYYEGEISTDVPWEAYMRKIQIVKMDNRITNIGDAAFADCVNLQLVYWPKELEQVGDHAFARCTSLQSIELPDTVERIGNYSFAGCENLYYFYFPKSLKTIGGSAFSGCKKIQTVELPDGVERLSSNAFGSCTLLSKVTLPESLKYIGGGAFFNCVCLNEIRIPESVEEIGNQAFQQCKYLSKINIESKWATLQYSNTFKDIADNAMFYCYKNSTVESYLQAENLPYQLLEEEEKEILVQAKGYHGVYDGKPHSISLSVLNLSDEEYTIYYSARENLCIGSSAHIYSYQETPIGISDVGTIKMYYYILAKGYPIKKDYVEIVIEKAPAQLSFPQEKLTKNMREGSFVQAVTADTDGEIQYQSSDDSVAEVDNKGRVKLKGEGTCVITATASAGQNYEAASASYELTVQKDENFAPIEIIKQPEDVKSFLGMPVEFEVEATGVGELSYEWRYSPYKEVDNEYYESFAEESATTSMLKTTVARWNCLGVIWCHITDDLGNELDTNGCVLTLEEAVISDTKNKKLANPTVELNSVNEPACKLWNTVWFGSFPQSEVRGEALKDEIIEAQYNRLGDAYVNGVKYRRELCNGNCEVDQRAKVDETSHYHYCKYEPIKWRVLQVAEDKCLLLSDKIIETKSYLKALEWLSEEDSDSFIATAFSLDERSAILKDAGRNAIFLLNQDDLRSSYGFFDTYNNKVEKQFCVSQTTDFANYSNYGKANRAGSWWIENQETTGGICVNASGEVREPSSNDLPGIRPALYLDITKENAWQYAGVVTSPSAGTFETDGKVEEVACELTCGDLRKLQTIHIKETEINKKYDEGEFLLEASTDGDGVIRYISEDTGVVKVSDEGKATIVGVGTTKISVLASGTDNYMDAQETVEVQIEKGERKLLSSSKEYTVKLDGPYQKLAVTTDKGGTIKYQCVSKPTTSATPIQVVSNNDIHASERGDYRIKAYIEEDGCYKSVEEIYTVHVIGKEEIITVEEGNDTFYLDDDENTISIDKLGDGMLTVRSSDDSIVEPGSFSKTGVEGDYTYSGELKIKKAGKVTLSIVSEATKIYERAEKQIVIQVVSDDDDDDTGEKVQTSAQSNQNPVMKTSLKKGELACDGKDNYICSSVKKLELIYCCSVFNDREEVTIPDTVKFDNAYFKVVEISDRAFINNKNLKKVKIGKYVRKIGKKSFYGCTNLKKVTIKSKKLKSSTVGKQAFKKTNKKLSFKVPKTKKAAYKKFLKKKGNSKAKIQ